MQSFCRNLSSTLTSTGWVILGAKFGEEGVDRYKPDFNAIWERHGAVVCKRNRFDVFCYLNTTRERDRQTKEQIAIIDVA